jgi:hypothetical protein
MGHFLLEPGNPAVENPPKLYTIYRNNRVRLREGQRNHPTTIRRDHRASNIEESCARPAWVFRDSIG